MAKIYKTFDEFFDDNQEIFSFFKKSKFKGTLQAIWEARSSEVATLRNELLRSDSAYKEEFKIRKDLESKFYSLQTELEAAIHNAANSEESLVNVKNQSEMKELVSSEKLKKAEEFLHEARKLKAHGEKLIFDAKEDRERAARLEEHLSKSQHGVKELVEYSDKLKEHSDNLEKDNKNKSFEIHRLKGELASIASSLDFSKQENSQLRTEITLQKEECEHLRSEIDRLKSFVLKAKGNVREVQEHAEKSRQFAERQRIELESALHESEEYKKVNASQEIRLRKLEEDLKCEREEKSIIKSNFDNTSLKFEKMKITFQRMVEETDIAKKDKVKLSEEREVLKAEIVNLVGEREKLTHELIQMNNVLKSIAGGLNNLQLDIVETKPLYQTTLDLLRDKERIREQGSKEMELRKRAVCFKHPGNEAVSN